MHYGRQADRSSGQQGKLYREQQQSYMLPQVDPTQSIHTHTQQCAGKL